MAERTRANRATQREGETDRRTDRQTDGQTDTGRKKTFLPQPPFFCKAPTSLVRVWALEHAPAQALGAFLCSAGAFVAVDTAGGDAARAVCAPGCERPRCVRRRRPSGGAARARRGAEATGCGRGPRAVPPAATAARHLALAPAPPAPRAGSAAAAVWGSTGRRRLLATATPARCFSETIHITVASASGDWSGDVKIGETLMDIALDNDLDMECACEGQLACSTCHVYVDQPFFDELPEIDEEEEDMLDLAWGLEDNSRLGCQIEMTTALDGCTFTIPDDSN